MKKQRKSNWVQLLWGTALIAVVVLCVGCPNITDKGGKIVKVIKMPPPEKPSFTGNQSGFELLLENMQTATDAAAQNSDNLAGVVAFTWMGEGALEYDIYWSEERALPVTPNAIGIKEQVYFARNLKEDTEYYFWVEARNPSGKTVSDPFVRKTGRKGAHANGGVERGDYPRNIKIIPGDGVLTVTWDIPDRAAWQEIYYAEAGEIPHVDVYTPIKFKWDDYLDPADVLKVAYQEYTVNSNPNSWPHELKLGSNTYYFSGYTRAIYPFCSPLAANGGWEGYYIGAKTGIDGDSRPVVGKDQFGQNGFPPAGAFPYVFESWKEGDGANDLGRLQPYQKLDRAFARAIPWDAANNRAGQQGTTIKSYTNNVTITGLENGKSYEVWIRCPNANGERGYGYAVGTPGAGSILPVPAKVQISTPPDTTRNLTVSWTNVPGAESYRIYASKYSYTPSAIMSFTRVEASPPLVYTLSGLSSGTDYYIWVVAEKNGLPGEFGAPASGKTGKALSAGRMGDKFIAGTDQKVKTAVYVEVNDRNPLNAGSYILEDGTYLFDYVILFAANIRNRNCAEETGEPHNCPSTGGPHLHMNENVRYILENRTTYIKPLQDKGIKVLLGLLGDHDGISFSTMNDSERAAFIADVKANLEKYKLDGIDFDDEWASKEAWDMSAEANNPTAESIWVYPISSWGWPFNMTVYRDPSKGVVAGNGTRTASVLADQNRMWAELGETYLKTLSTARQALPSPRYTISLYEYNSGRYIAATQLQDVVDFAMQPWYNQYLDESANGLPRSMYSPFGIDLSGNAYASFNGAAYPPISNTSGSEAASGTIRDYSTRFVKAAKDGNAYNMLYFYGLEEVSRMVKRHTQESAATVSREDYISKMTNIIFGQSCVLTAEGGDYRKNW